MKSYMVLHTPYGEQGNPYQTLLLESLHNQGVKAKGVDTRRIFSVLGAVISNWKPDVLHLHWQHPFLLASSRLKTLIKSTTFVLELLVLKVLGVKIVWTVHNLKNHENRYQKLELFFTTIIAHLADAIIAHCETAKCKIQKEFNLKSDFKINVIPHGNYLNYYKNNIDQAEARRRLGLPISEFVFLCLGLIRPYKGVLNLIDSFKKLNHQDARLLIAGRPCDDEMNHLLRRKIDNRKDIELIPKFIPDDEIQVYMKAADVVVFSYREILTSGGVILAMSFGKPIIAPDMNCISDVLDNAGSFLYDPASNDGLLKAMKESIVAKDDLSTMGKHNLKLAEKLGWEEIAKSTLQVYEQAY